MANLNYSGTENIGGLSFDGGVTYAAASTYARTGATHNESAWLNSGILNVGSPTAITVTAVVTNKVYDGTTTADSTPTITSGTLLLATRRLCQKLTPPKAQGQSR